MNPWRRALGRWIAALLVVGLGSLWAAPKASAGEVEQGSFPSPALGEEMRYSVYLPQGYAQGDQHYPVVYLLHGHGGDETDWLRWGHLVRTADRLIRSGAVPPFIAVMPAGRDRWWVDSPAGQAQTALVQDLPAHIESRYRAISARSGRAIGGLSAGGYGAVLAGLKHPDRYAAVAALSPAVYEPEPPPGSGARQVAAFRRDGAFDAATWARLGVASAWPGYANSGSRLPFFLLSGDPDGLGITPQTSALHARLFAHQPEQVSYRVVAGTHDWPVWREGLGEALAYLGRHLSPPQAKASAVGTEPGSLRLAPIFGDRMVLQRGQALRIWGWATPEQRVAVTLRGQQRAAIADAQGRWQVMLPAAPAGGPHVLEVQAGAERLRLQDVLLGDVWLCAGQSNMEWPLVLARHGAAEVALADHPLIRHVRVTPQVAFAPTTVPASPLTWKASYPATAGPFSAVGYFFAQRMQRELGVPIGLVNISWGGSQIEAWMSRDAFARDRELAFALKGFPDSLQGWLAHREAAFAALLQRFQPGLPGAIQKPEHWAHADTDDRAWPRLQTPGLWEDQGLQGFDGHVWLRRTVELTAEQARAPSAALHFGPIDDCDETWVNGQALGKTCAWDQPRRYAVPAGTLRAGMNLIAVRVTDTGGGGGFHGQTAQLRLEGPDWNLPLAGPWAARVESALASAAPSINSGPALGFEGMVRPLTPLPIRGVLWYQGESNVPRAEQYQRSFALLIDDWRRHWQQPALPFHFVQLASFRPETLNTLAGSPWAELRDAQRLTLALPHTGMAVTTDLGDADDIHPVDKREVGERLALISLRQDFRHRVAASGPVLREVRFRAGQAQLRFGETAGALAVREPGDALQGFALAGADRRFHAAQARISGDRVTVWSAAVPTPVALRYAWVDNPLRSNLVNAAGLPASPFRTDRWPFVTQGVRYQP